MSTEIKPAFVSQKVDAEDNTIIRPSNWNDPHDFLIDHQDLQNKGTASHNDIDTHIEDSSIHTPTNHNHNSVYAPIAKGVTNGDTHDHDGGDGAQINHNNLSNIGTYSHQTIS